MPGSHRSRQGRGKHAPPGRAQAPGRAGRTRRHSISCGAGSSLSSPLLVRKHLVQTVPPFLAAAAWLDSDGRRQLGNGVSQAARWLGLPVCPQRATSDCSQVLQTGHGQATTRQLGQDLFWFKLPNLNNPSAYLTLEDGPRRVRHYPLPLTSHDVSLQGNAQ